MVDHVICGRRRLRGLEEELGKYNQPEEAGVLWKRDVVQVLVRE